MGKSYSTTTITDLRQAAEADVVSGVGSQLALPGGVALGEGASFSITGATPLDAGKTFDAILSNTDSTLGRVLGLTSQLASGLFEQTPGGIAAMQAGQPGTQQAGILAGDSTLVLILGIVLLFMFAGVRK